MRNVGFVTMSVAIFGQMQECQLDKLHQHEYQSTVCQRLSFISCWLTTRMCSWLIGINLVLYWMTLCQHYWCRGFLREGHEIQKVEEFVNLSRDTGTIRMNLLRKCSFAVHMNLIRLHDMLNRHSLNEAIQLPHRPPIIYQCISEMLGVWTVSR